MIIDGERLKSLVSEAKREVTICAPFIKTHALQAILSSIQAAVKVRVVTRWRPAEVAAGVSDLEVFEVLNDRGNAQLELLDELHAKLYISDNRCLIGSANITAAALGWSERPNVEFLTELPVANPDVQALMGRLSAAQRATFQEKAEIAKKAEELAIPSILDDSSFTKENIASAARPWLPKCATPDRLFAVYQDDSIGQVVLGTKEDALDDLRDLSPPPKLSQAEFTDFISSALSEFPAFNRFLSRIASKLTDSEALAVMQEIRPDLDDQDAQKQWEIVRDWIGAFFSDRFEVAPESFVVRMKRN